MKQKYDIEYWDLYNDKREKINKTIKRGDKLLDSEYHLVANAWIVNDNNEFLITQRNENKSHPLMWECTGGSALIGETTLDAAIREVKEELGINIYEKDAVLIGSKKRYYPNCPDFLDVYIFKSNVLLKNIKIQEEEINDVMWASKEKILKLYEEGNFEANAFFNEVLDFEIK